jgi:hypothetical protein
LPDDQVDRALHASLLDLESKRDWLWLQNINSTLAMASDDQKLAEPADLRAVESLAFIDTGLGTTYDILELAPLAGVRAMARGTSNGFPTQYNRSGASSISIARSRPAKKFELIYESRTPSDLDAAIAAGSNTTLSLHQQPVIAKACATPEPDLPQERGGGCPPADRLRRHGSAPHRRRRCRARRRLRRLGAARHQLPRRSLRVRGRAWLTP